MAEKDGQQGPEGTDGSAGPSLELPSFGFRRKRKKAASQPAPEPVTEPALEPVPEPVAAAPEPEPQPRPAPGPTPEPAPAARAPQPFPERPAAAPTTPTPTPVVATAEEPAATEAEDREDDTNTRQGPSMPTLPTLAPAVAGLVTGLVVGLVVVGLTWASQGVCQLARGTSSCGNAGFLLLLAVLLAGAWLGGALLVGFGVEDGRSTSFLAVGIVAVVLMLFLAEALFSWWMVVVVPLVSVAAYVGSHRVTTAMVEPGGPELRR